MIQQITLPPLNPNAVRRAYNISEIIGSSPMVDKEDFDSMSSTLHEAIIFRGEEAVLEELRLCGECDIPLCERRITPLHLASMFGYQKVVRALIDKGVKVNYQDFHGYTALHHAALCGHQEVVEILLEANADPERFSYMGEVYDQLTENTKFDYDHQKPLPVWTEDCEGHLQQLSMRGYYELTGAYYVDTNVKSRELLVNDWHQYQLAGKILGLSGGLSDQLLEFFDSSYFAGEENLPQFVLKQSLQDDSSLGLGVFAKEGIPAGRYLGSYEGLICSNLQSDSDPTYHMEYNAVANIDAKEIGCPLSRVQLGFPNLINFEGGFYAIEEIEGQLLWNYGDVVYHAEMPFVEINPQGTRDFVKEHTVEGMLDHYDRLKNNFTECSFDDLVLITKVFYFFCVPQSVLFMYLEGVINEREAFLLFDRTHCYLTIHLVDFSDEVGKIIDRNPEKRQEILSYVKKIIAKQGLMQGIINQDLESWTCLN